MNLEVFELRSLGLASGGKPGKAGRGPEFQARLVQLSTTLENLFSSTNYYFGVPGSRFARTDTSPIASKTPQVRPEGLRLPFPLARRVLVGREKSAGLQLSCCSFQLSCAVM